MCYDLYNETINIPRNLLCGHTFCEACIVKIHQIKTTITCPTCRTEHDPLITIN